MERKISVEWRLAALAVAAVFLFTSCPALMLRPKPEPKPPEDTGTIKYCYLDRNGESTSNRDESCGIIYWVEKDGAAQPGFMSVLDVEPQNTVVNFVDEAAGVSARFFFIDRADLPNRAIIDWRDASGAARSFVWEDIRYDMDLQRLSFRLAEVGAGGKSRAVSGVRLNKSLFGTRHNSTSGPDERGFHSIIIGSLQFWPYYATAASSCLLYAMGHAGSSGSLKEGGEFSAGLGGALAASPTVHSFATALMGGGGQN